MVDDGHAPTIPETEAPTHPSSKASAPRAPDPRYEMRALLGRGGMGEIWAAYDVRVDREVAVKLMRSSGASDPDAVARFLREARVQGRLEHPAIVPVHDLGIGDEPYFVMKRLTGTTLADVLTAKARGDGDASERWPTRILLARLVDVCLAIELAHQGGVIHRDLKPANIMLGDFGEAYVLDWGLARVRDGGEPGAIRGSDLPSDPGHTVAGAMLGTPGYMPPEQVRGDAIDVRADIYALGCILYEILAGQPAVPRDSAIEATLNGNGHRPSRVTEIAPELDDVCVRATAAEPAARHGSARALADDIQRFLDGDRDLARRRELAAQHVASAERALASDDRAAAMREAGRAIAIDPDGTAAQDLMKRLLFELPREVPPEARAAVEAERQHATQSAFKTMTLAYVAFGLALPLAFALGAPLSWQLIATAVSTTAMITASAIYARKPRKATFAVTLGLLLSHACTLTFASLTIGPLLVIPVILVGSSAIAQTLPAVHLGRAVLITHVGALLLPLILEWTGVTARSYHGAGTSVVFDPPVLGIDGNTIVLVMVGAIIAQLIANSMVSRSQRREQELAQEKVHAYAWHLAQLVR